MAEIQESVNWVDGIHQIEDGDHWSGGSPSLDLGAGIANIQAQQLGDRTQWLKAKVEELENRTIIIDGGEL